MELPRLSVSNTFNSIKIFWDATGNVGEDKLDFVLSPFGGGEEQQLQVLANQGEAFFPFLQERSKFRLVVTYKNKSSKLELETMRYPFGGQRFCGGPKNFVSPQHAIGTWVQQAKGDWMWALVNDIKTSVDFFDRLYEQALFTLPHENSELIPIINPVERYCIDLTDDSFRWASSKRVRRHKKDFTLSVSHAFRRSLETLARTHTQLHGSTWLIPDLIELFVRMRADPSCRVRHQSFELWEGDTLVAVVLGFGIGRCFHDYSMCTFVRDHRSSGNILSRVVGDLLKKCGYKIWYWGVKGKYMAEYDCKGGANFPRQQFAERWYPNKSLVPDKNIEDAVREGMALVAPKIV